MFFENKKTSLSITYSTSDLFKAAHFSGIDTQDGNSHLEDFVSKKMQGKFLQTYCQNFIVSLQ